eukprot:550101_1
MTLSDLELFEYILDERHVNQSHKKLDDESKGNKVDDDVYVFKTHEEAWNDVIDMELLGKIEIVCKQRWDTMMGDEETDEVSDRVNLKSKIMRSLFDIDNLFQIHQNKSKFKQISKFLLKGAGDMEAMDKFNESEEDCEGNDMELDEEDEKEDVEKELVVVMLPEAPGDMLYHKNTLTKEELKLIRKANKKIVKAANRERR